MDPGEFPAGKLPRRELQGPRPAPLRVRKDSHKIRKPPVAPPPQPPQAQPQHRPPVIIYTVSPKVIHANPSEFMTLVQRLTGSSSSTSSSMTSFSSSSNIGAKSGGGGGGVSPAARFAAIEKARSTATEEEKKPQKGEVVVVEGVESRVERTGSQFPGILSPGPGSLQPIPAGFFSPSTDPNSLGFFQDLSPGLFGNRNYAEEGNGSSFMSPSTFFSPTPYLDLFNNFSDP